jgi:hypothetical protein
MGSHIGSQNYGPYPSAKYKNVLLIFVHTPVGTYILSIDHRVTVVMAHQYLTPPARSLSFPCIVRS